MEVVQLLPDGHHVKKEVDAALDTVSETMTPMHYHLREIIICTYRQVSPIPLGSWLCRMGRGSRGGGEDEVGGAGPVGLPPAQFLVTFPPPRRKCVPGNTSISSPKPLPPDLG